VAVRESRPSADLGHAIARSASGSPWCPDVADHRDYSLKHKTVVSMLNKLTTTCRSKADFPQTVDWREYCGRVEDEAQCGTSTSHACVALIQQFERRSSGRLLHLSRLFVHHTARRMAHGPTLGGISLRMALKAISRCGIPPEKYVPYDHFSLEHQPDAFAFSFQRGFRSLRYLRLDDRQSTGDEILMRLRSFLAAGFPIVLGFPLHSSISNEPEILFPTGPDAVVGGQAVTAVGFDDKLRIRSGKGALLIRNSWGPTWGDDGYGWLPYTYVTERLAVDFWTLLKPSWLRSGEFERPVLIE
jgi:C1A family cysteine protease